jgi:isochorismate hydrolase
MFVRTKNRANGKVTIFIVETVRTKDKVHQKTVRTVATVFPDEVSRFVELARHIKSEMEVARLPKLFPAQTLAETVTERSRSMVISSRKRSVGDESPLPVNLRAMREESRIVTGIHEVSELLTCHLPVFCK